VIPVTDEMYNAFRAALADGNGYWNALAAVLVVVERDHLRPAPGPDRCSTCGRTSRNLTPVTELVDARLGPSCHARYLRSGGGRQALPIGGTQ
jgi:hypothetical protein